jgi:long-chain acyl-CoA synthetase
MYFWKNIIKNKANFIFYKNNKKYIKSIKQVLLDARKIYKPLKIDSANLIFLEGYNDISFFLNYLFFLENENPVFLLDKNPKKAYLKNLIKKFKPSYCILQNSSNLEKYEEREKFLFKNNYDFTLLKFDEKKILNKDLRFLIPTSGSTSQSKFVKLSKNNIDFITKQISTRLEISKNETVMTTLPPNYVYGLSVINCHLFVGTNIVINNFSPIEKKFWDLIHKEKIKTISGVPYTYEIFDKLKIYKSNLKHLKKFTQAGGELSTDIKSKFLDYCKKHKKKFYVMYGQTEAASRITILDFLNLESKIKSIGKPINKGILYPVDKRQKRIIKPYQEGELVYEGKNIMMGYCENLKELNQNNNIKRLFTGDIGYFDKENFFFITGRKNRIIKIFGTRINLSDLENDFIKNKLKTCLLFKHNKIYIFIQNKKLEKKVLNVINERINLNKLIFKIKILKHFPRNNNDKINYNKLQKLV